MNFAEFTHWLDGFSEAMGDAPTPEQWAKIKAKLAKVNTYIPGDINKVLHREPLWTGMPDVRFIPKSGSATKTHDNAKAT